MNRAYRTREFCGAKLGKENEVFRPDGKLLYVERSLKNGTDELTEYIWAGSTLWAEKRTAGTESAVYYHHTDYHGSTEAITDEAGVVVWKAGYDAYGNMLQATGVTEFEASYTGKMYDRDTGLYYFNARWYDAELGRFTTPDPARDGMNWVVYCAANPVGRWDPTGLGTLDDFAYQQRTNSQHGSEEYENSFKIEEDAARRNQGVSTEVATPQSTWSETIEPIITSTFWEVTTGLFNCDFGVDCFKKAGYAWNNGQYIKALLDSTNGIGEAVLDCLFIYDTAATYGPWIEAAVQNLFNRGESGNTTSFGLPAPTPAEQARAWQGTKEYPGVDDWVDVTIKKGSYVWGGTPGQSQFYTTASDMLSAGNDATKIFKGLQVRKGQFPTYRGEMTLYQVPYDMDVAISQAMANTNYGEGGFTQLFIPDYSDLKIISKIPLINR